MDEPSLQQQIEACDFGANYWQSIARSRRPDHEAQVRAEHYRAAAKTLRQASPIAAFASGLKAHLHATLSDSLPGALHGTGIFSPARIKRGAWDALDAAIDAFAAEFQAGKG
jgi:hypothetical protein